MFNRNNSKYKFRDKLNLGLKRCLYNNRVLTRNESITGFKSFGFVFCPVNGLEFGAKRGSVRHELWRQFFAAEVVHSFLLAVDCDEYHYNVGRITTAMTIHQK